MTWFDRLTGFPEKSGADTRDKLVLEGTQLKSLVNGRTLDAGRFTTPQLSELQPSMVSSGNKRIRVQELVADVQTLHRDPANVNAVFQVASQFNCLEMVDPHCVPEDGVGIYEHDRTQGPACSIAAGAGTIYRNYFAEVNGQVGQTRNNQIDCLAPLESHFGKGLWQMKNGYCFPSEEGLSTLEERLSTSANIDRDELRGLLKVGVQSNTQVTLGDADHLVTQVFCSALPISYSNLAPAKWNHFPRLILDATYEATFAVAANNFEDTGCSKLYLTLVGGGVFGNRLGWILNAIDRSLNLFASAALDVHIVSYGRSNPAVADLIAKHET